MVHLNFWSDDLLILVKDALIEQILETNFKCNLKR